MQIHPIAHEGFETDFINDIIPDYLTVQCGFHYYIGKKNKRLEIKLDSIFVGSAYKMFSDLGLSEPISAFSIPLNQIRKLIYKGKCLEPRF